LNQQPIPSSFPPEPSSGGSGCDAESLSETGTEYLTIGALAKLCNVTVRTLRYYEETDLIGPIKRSHGRYRLYNRRSLHRVQAILALQELHFSLEEILAVLGPYSTSRSYTKEEQVAHTRESLLRQQTLIREKMARMSRLCEDIDARLRHLSSACVPCMEKSPSRAHCQEDCTHLNVHD
jgi:DNA-binding transcriptional MerR regulator